MKPILLGHNGNKFVERRQGKAFNPKNTISIVKPGGGCEAGGGEREGEGGERRRNIMIIWGVSLQKELEA